MGNGRTLIAVVEDEPPVRTMLSRALRVADFDVTVYATGADFMTALPARSPACAIVDVHLPGMSGLDVAREVRSSSHPFPLILITASDVDAIGDEAAAAGALRLLRKPFSTGALLVAVHEALASQVAPLRLT